MDHPGRPNTSVGQAPPQQVTAMKAPPGGGQVQRGGPAPGQPNQGLPQRAPGPGQGGQPNQGGQQQAPPQRNYQLPPLPARTDWFTMGDQIFQHTKFYQNSDWGSVDFKRQRIIAANFGGPVAVFSSDASSEESKSIEIFTASGKPVGKINTTNFSHLIVGTGWNDMERLVIVTADANVSIYTVQGEVVRTWKLERCADGVLSAKVWGTGLVCLTKKFDLFTIYNFDKPHERELKKPGLQQPPSCWNIIEPKLSSSGMLQVLLCLKGNGSVMVVTEQYAVDVGVNLGPFTHISVSASGKLVALYTPEAGRNLIWILTADFCTELVRFNVSTHAPGPPQQLEWLANEAVVACWETELDHVLLMVTPDAHYSSTKYDLPIRIVSECDGLRVVGQGECGFIFRTAPAQKLIYGPGANNAAFWLFRASLYYHKDKSPKCDAIMRDFTRRELIVGVEILMDAAAAEFDTNRQADLLAAAAFGKSYLEDVKVEKFAKICKDLRVLNTARTEEIGVPLSHAQYTILTPQLFVNRLLNRDLHHLAVKLCAYLGLPSDPVLVHWATRKVASKLSDDEIISNIVEKTRHIPGVSYAAVAFAAYKKNKPDLAASLLDFESRAEEQVPLLIKMDKHDLSLEKACQAGDTDLIQLALLVLQKNLDQTDFYTLLRSHDEARWMWENYCRLTNRPGLMTMYRAGGGNSALAREEVIDAHASAEVLQRVEKLKKAVAIYKKTDKFAHQQTEDELKLLEFQIDLEKNFPGTEFVGSSLYSTLYRCIMLGHEKKSKEIREAFKVPNKRWWWIKIRAYSQSGKWDSLRRFSEQRSPIGFQPFFDVCFEAKNNEEAFFYVLKITDEVEKCKGLVILGKWQEAVEFVKVMKADPGDLIQWMKTKATHNVWKLKIAKLEEMWAAGELGSFFGAEVAELNLGFGEGSETQIDGFVANIEETLSSWTESIEGLWSDKK